MSGRYHLIAEVGRGGSATVWRARDDRVDADVAVKLLHIADPMLRGQLRSRLASEGAILSRLAHPYVLRVFDSGTDGEDDFIVTELADGGTLADVLQRDGPLAPRAAVRMALQALAALQAAHEAGVVHRDVKPANLLLVRGDVRLADFGIAQGRDESRHTRTGVAMGSWAFMAPEQRVDARSVGPTADVYALGATLYNLVTGATPTDLFLAERGSPRWADVPEDLIPILRRATHGKPESRWRSAAEMASALAPLLDTLPVAVSAPTRPTDGTPVHAPTATTPASQTMPLDRRPATPAAPPIRVRPRIVPLLPAMGLVVATTSAGVWLATSWKPFPGGSTAIEAASIQPAALALPVGLWRGRLGEHAVFVDLDGPPDAVVAEVTVVLGANASVHRAEGRWDGLTRTLMLRDVGDFPLAADWTASLTESGVTLEGTGRTRASGEAWTLTLLLEPPD